MAIENLTTIEKFCAAAEQYFADQSNAPFNMPGLAYFIGASNVHDIWGKKSDSDKWKSAIERQELRIEMELTRGALTKELDANMVARYNMAYNDSYRPPKTQKNSGTKVIIMSPHTRRNKNLTTDEQKAIIEITKDTKQITE